MLDTCKNLHKLKPNDFQFYTVAEVALLLKVKKPFVYELIYTGQLLSIQFSKRRIRIAKSSLEEFIMQEMDKTMLYNKVVQSPKKGRRPNGTIKK